MQTPSVGWSTVVFLNVVVLSGLLVFFFVCPTCPPFNILLNVTDDFSCRAPHCIRKCCPQDQELRISTNGTFPVCGPTNTSLSITEFSNMIRSKFGLSEFTLLNHGVAPSGMQEVVPSANKSLFLDNGKISSLDNFCFDLYKKDVRQFRYTRSQQSTAIRNVVLLILTGCVVFFMVVACLYFLITKIKVTKTPEIWQLLMTTGLLLIILLPMAYIVGCPTCVPFRHQDNNNHNQCTSPPCIKKCCAQHEELSLQDEVLDCSPSSSRVPLNVSFWDDIDNRNHTVLDSQKTYCRRGFYELEPSDVDYNHTYLSNGSLFLLYYGKVVDDYCVDTTEGDNMTRLYRCFPQKATEKVPEWQIKLFVKSQTVSAVLLFLTMVIYLFLPLPELKNLHGKVATCNVTSLFVAYVTIILTQVNVFNMNHRRTLCVYTAFVMQYAFLATFFWLNVMCFDIWWVFSGLSQFQGSEKERDNKKFIFYSLYAWGMPAIIVSITLVMELLPSIPDTFIKPHFGDDKCWFKDSDALALYFYLPIGVIVVMNLVMFVTTAFRLRAHKRATKKAFNSSESRRTVETDRQRFNLYLKLFVVMGVNWVMELISFVVGGPKSIWFAADLGNTLQGVLIFCIFVCKRRILRMLNQKICPRWDLLPSTSSTRGSKTEKLESAKGNVK